MIPFHLQCQKCQHCLDTPMLLSCCSSTVCWSCMSYCNELLTDCPICHVRIDASMIFRNRAMEEALNYFNEHGDQYSSTSGQTTETESECSFATNTDYCSSNDMENINKIMYQRKRKRIVNGVDAILHLSPRILMA